MKNAIRLILAVLLAAASPALAAAPSLVPIGAAAAVRGAVKAAAPGEAVGRIIGSGKPLFLNDHVTTDAQGRLQILLLDETVFTIGPNSDMVLDTFVYDPATNAGKVSAQIAKGVFRFVTGKVARAHPEDMKVKLNVGVIGIRGTVVVGETGPEGSTVINAGAGPDNNADEPPSAISVTNAGRTVTVEKTGEGVRVAPGAGPSSPTDLTKELDRLSGILQSPRGQQAAKGPLDAPAARRSGHSTGRGRDLAVDELSDLALNSNASSLQTGANQQGLGNLVPDGTSDWSQIAQLQGTGVYNGSGVYSCTGAGCSGTGSLTFQLNVNFDTRKITGGTATMGTPTAGFFSGDSTSFNPSSAFPASGPATITATTSNSFFNGTSFTFLNKGGTVAAEAQMKLQYANASSSTNGTGTVTGSR